jgi:hypothetical protein
MRDLPSAHLTSFFNQPKVSILVFFSERSGDKVEKALPSPHFQTVLSPLLQNVD